jgi:hypothetical protein
MGNAAGRPLINAVGKPRVVINGTALDYLAESFMAGDPHNGGGFVVLNGIGFSEEDGSIREYESPYPGSNIFSLASGGAIYVRDPRRKLVDEQLNGGEFARVTDADWKLILPYLEENEKLFGITIDRLLTVDDKKRAPKNVYRKIRPKKTGAAALNDDGLPVFAPAQERVFQHCSAFAIRDLASADRPLLKDPHSRNRRSSRRNHRGGRPLYGMMPVVMVFRKQGAQVLRRCRS